MYFVSTGMISYKDNIGSTLGKGEEVGKKSLHENKHFEGNREGRTIFDNIVCTLDPAIPAAIYLYFFFQLNQFAFLTLARKSSQYYSTKEEFHLIHITKYLKILFPVSLYLSVSFRMAAVLNF